MNPVLLIRTDFVSKYELHRAGNHFPMIFNRTRCRNQLVIGRYSVLPFYHEVEADLIVNNCRLINSVEQHKWIAEFKYYNALKELTPETWDDTNIHLCDHRGPFVVKGKLTSKKRQWNKCMFAKTKKQALAIGRQLKEDTWIGDQEVIYRKYVPLRTLGKGPNELPFANEWRFFFYKDRCLSYAYYWSMSDCARLAEMTPAGLNLAKQIAKTASKHSNFYTLDIAETENGKWILIEINDGQMATLCENDPEEMYKNLQTATAAHNKQCY